MMLESKNRGSHAYQAVVGAEKDRRKHKALVWDLTKGFLMFILNENSARKG